MINDIEIKCTKTGDEIFIGFLKKTNKYLTGFIIGTTVELENSKQYRFVINEISCDTKYLTAEFQQQIIFSLKEFLNREIAGLRLMTMQLNEEAMFNGWVQEHHNSVFFKKSLMPTINKKRSIKNKKIQANQYHNAYVSYKQRLSVLTIENLKEARYQIKTGKDQYGTKSLLFSALMGAIIGQILGMSAEFAVNNDSFICVILTFLNLAYLGLIISFFLNIFHQEVAIPLKEFRLDVIDSCIKEKEMQLFE